MERTPAPRPARTSLAAALSALACALAFAVTGCSASVGSAPDGSGPGSDASADVQADTGGGCTLSNGAFCPTGMTCPAPDGCNTCVCMPDGRAACTVRACIDPCRPHDARGEGDCDAIVGNAWNGRDCVALSGCRCVGADCNLARQSREACLQAHAQCLRGSADAGPGVRGCTTSADCPSGSVCEGMGCGTPDGVCAPATRGCTADIAQYCGCDGVTFQSSGSCPNARFRYRGPCR